MSESDRTLELHSPLAALIENFIQEKRACGYGYVTGSRLLQSFDRFLVAEGLADMELPRWAVERWTAKMPHEKPTNQAARLYYTRQFAQFLVRQGLKAFIPDTHRVPIFRADFVPHIFSVGELRSLFEAADRLRPNRNSLLRHIVLPEIFRVLYGCGLRASECLKVPVDNVDLREGIFSIRGAKFRKDRLVPIAPGLLEHLRAYASKLGERSAGAPFFPGPEGRPYDVDAIYAAFRKLLWAAGIPHRGRGRGPRLHDLRHTFAVHRLVRWYREGVDLNAKLPILAVYMGHVGLHGCQRYLRLIPALYPDVAARQQAVFGEVIPQRGEA